MNATIITIGDELLIGQVINTNSAWLATELTAIGFSVRGHVSISDSEEDIRHALDHYLPENDLLIITGGLGPTNDDITKKVLAGYFNTGLVFSEQVYTDVEAFISGIGSSMRNIDRRQAMQPEAATILRNHHGTAAGMWFEQDGRVVISLPGVPREMKGIFSDYIKTGLSDYFKLPEILYKTVMFTGITEAHLASKLAAWEKSIDGGISVAYLPSPGQIRLRLGINGGDKAGIDAVLRKEIDKLQVIAGNYIYGFDNESIELVTGRMIFERAGYLVTAESCTGGTAAQRITAIPGCSAWFKGGIVAYSNEAKEKLLGVKHETLENFGAVSRETVEQMAVGVLKAFNADYAISTSGIAGPDGGTEEKPVGTVWIAAAGPGFLVSKKFTFGKDRAMNIQRSTAAAFNMLRTAILDSK